MKNDVIYTVFPLTGDEMDMPRSFPTYSEAVEYGDWEWGEGNYEIESPC